MDLKLLESILQKCWSKETCYPPIQKNWSPKNPALGQCAVTALVIQDYLGGDLLYCKHIHHYWNRLPDGKVIDLTKQQFPKGTKICLDEIRTREYTLKSKIAKKVKTQERYEILKKRVLNLLKEKSNK